MSEANSQYGTLLSLEPEKLDFQYYYAVTCTADSSLREEGIERLIALQGQIESEGERLFFLALAYHHNEDFVQATKLFKRAIQNSDKKSNWAKEAELRLLQCEASIDLLPPTISIAYSSQDDVELNTFFRFIPTDDTPFRITLVPSELRSKLDKKRGWVSPVVYSLESDVIYFCSYGNKGSTGLDIYMAKIMLDGSLSKPQRLPDVVNSASDEINPVYHKETGSIIFASNRASSLGGYDLFSSNVISHNGKYKSPKRLPRVWNTSSNEYFLFPESNTLIDGNVSGGWLVSDRSGHFSSPVLYLAQASTNSKPEVVEEAVVADDVVVDVLEVLSDDVVEVEEKVVVEADPIIDESTNDAPEIKESMELEKVVVDQEIPVQKPVQKPVLKPELAIQVGVFKSLPDVGFLPENTEIIIKTLPNGLIKVYAGPFINEEERRNAKAELIAFGLEDVFNSTVIQTEEIKESLQTPTQDAIEGIHPTEKLTGVWYAVQIAAFSGEPDQSMLSMTKGNLFHELLDNGVKRWYTEANRSVDETLEMLPVLIERGARPDAFIVQLENGKRIKIVSANSITRKRDDGNVQTSSASDDFYRVRIASFVNSIPAIEAAALLHLGTLVTVRSIDIAGEKVYFTSKLTLDDAERAYKLSVQEGFQNARIEKIND